MAMNTGLLWYDDDARKSLNQKIDEAAARFREKFGQSPTICYVSQSVAADVKHPRLKVIGNQRVRPNHLWIGKDD